MEQSQSYMPLSRLHDWRLREEDYDVRGWTVVADDEANFGSVDDLIIDLDKSQVAFLVVAYDQLLGFGGKQALVPIDRVRIYPDQEGVIFEGSAREIKDGPEYRKDTNDFRPFFSHWGVKEEVKERETAGRKGGGAATAEREAAAKETGKLNLNRASRDELIALKGIGPVLADNILRYREDHKFKSVNELKEVEGVSDTVIKDIRKHLEV